jgi:FHS family L-fucose permease-like MFS transporter
MGEAPSLAVMAQPHGRSTATAFAVVTALFFMWGFITVLVDSLVPRLREVFTLSFFQAGLLQFAFFIAYGVVSIPAGQLLARIGYRKGMVLGLITMGAGCLLYWPAAGLRLLPVFMLGTFVLAAGMTVLQVAANPYVAVLGEERGASSRLNLAQAFNSVGTTLAPVVGARLILSDRIRDEAEIAAMDETARETYFAAEASAVQGPFVWLAGSLLMLAVIVRLAKLPSLLGGGASRRHREALDRPRLLLGAVGIFLYVGAEVAIGSYLVNYFLSMGMAEAVLAHPFMARIAALFHGGVLEGVDAKGVVGGFVALYWGGAMVGRFAGSYLTHRFPPGHVLGIFAMAVFALIATSMLTTGFTAMFSILAVGLFNSIMFPTIFSLAIEGLGDLKPQASGILCTAIAGGAFVPPMLGWLADGFGFKAAFVLLLCCYGYILFYATRTSSAHT